ncbi:MAG: response regulator [Gammaproteobacteria bacterium]
MQAAAQITPRPKLLFVDDEQRVLNSMRIMFKRDYELFLASQGSEALAIIKDNDIDVIVADHRMPRMTGVEVLTEVRSVSPRTVRILLTGYADLDAVEGSINDSEVFRFLTKPCAPKELRSTIRLAEQVAQEGPAELDDDLNDDEAVEIILEANSITEVEGGQSTSTTHSLPMLEEPPPPPEQPKDPAETDVLQQPAIAAPEAEPPAAPAPEAPAPTAVASSAVASSAAPAAAPTAARGKLGVLVFSADDEVLSMVNQAVRARIPVYHATNIVKVIRILTEHRPGVLLTDISDDRQTIQAMTARLKEHLPELVTIAVSAHRDVLDMVWLINHGQIFRFLRKPLSPGRCAVSLQAALRHHRVLLKNPALLRRHELETSDGGNGGILESMVQHLKAIRRLWQRHA